jgi:hypothetical protein
MSLAPGFRLGPYEILSALGAGGVGAVYRARDTRLNATSRSRSSRTLCRTVPNTSPDSSEAVAREPGRRLEPRDASRSSASRPVSDS